MEEYRIGKFTFDTYEDYVRGKADVKTIYKITHSVDIYRPDVALRLYQAIRNGKLKIYSEIGERFLLDLADIVAESADKKKQPEKIEENSKSEKQAQVKQTKPKDEAKVKQETVAGDRSRKILGAVCFVAAIACFVWYFWSDFTNARGNKVNDYLRDLKENPQEQAEEVETLSNDAFFVASAPELEASATGETAVESIENLTVLPEYEAILQENQDFAGWITIEGTKIDYPVMLTKSDADYYLMRNFNRQDDINGTLFMDARTNLEQRSTNIIIYGHNMKSGEMFGSLKSYLNEDYWLEHQQISFDTIYESGTYEIFAVCLAQVQYQNEDGFRYYDFIQADSEEAFQEYLDNIEQLSVFMGTDMPVYGDELLTLSTCNNYVEDGRLFLVAKKCMDAE